MASSDASLPASPSIRTEPFPLQAADGRSLAAELISPPSPSAAVVVANAMGVRRGYYRPFAEHLASAGLATLLFDWRGIGDSAQTPVRSDPARFHEWGEADLPAAIDALEARFPDLPLLHVGHSAGGQVLGMAPNAGKLSGSLLVASQLGYWKLWPGLSRVWMFGNMFVLIPGFTRALGYVPMRRFGQGEDLPPGIGSEWARFCRHPDYVLSRGGPSFATFGGPIFAFGFTDDFYAPEPAIRALLTRGYPRSSHLLRMVSPSEVGHSSIGHFGFFRPKFASTLWAKAVELLRAAAARPAAPAR